MPTNKNKQINPYSPVTLSQSQNFGLLNPPLSILDPVHRTVRSSPHSTLLKMKYQLIKQYSEEDCGAACLATIAKHYHRTFTLNRIREAVGTGQLGTTLLGLRQGADTLGFNARSVRASSEIFNRINEAPLPAIIHWKGYHWVVLYGKRGNKFVIADPGAGIRYVEKKWLMEAWTDG